MDTEPNDTARANCLDMKKFPPFAPIQRSISYSNTIYILPTTQCDRDCSGNGLCSLSRCTCKNGFHGLACEWKNCPNSTEFCFTNNLSLERNY